MFLGYYLLGTGCAQRLFTAGPTTATEGHHHQPTGKIKKPRLVLHQKLNQGSIAGESPTLPIPLHQEKSRVAPDSSTSLPDLHTFNAPHCCQGQVHTSQPGTRGSPASYHKALFHSSDQHPLLPLLSYLSYTYYVQPASEP